MPGEVIDQPNPPPLPSDLPEELDKFAVQLQNISLDQKDYDDLAKFRRAACYIAAGVYHPVRTVSMGWLTTFTSNDIPTRQCVPEKRDQAGGYQAATTGYVSAFAFYSDFTPNAY